MMACSQAMRVAAIGPIDSDVGVLWYVAEYVLQPPEPESIPDSSNTAVGSGPARTGCRRPRPLWYAVSFHRDPKSPGCIDRAKTICPPFESPSCKLAAVTE